MPPSINGHVEQSETSPPFMFRVELEDVMEKTPSGHPERSEGSPPFPQKGLITLSFRTKREISSVQSKGVKSHFRTDTKCRPERSEGSPIQSKGENDPFRTYPRKTKISFSGGVGGGDFFPLPVELFL